jgi:hypothetical protein
VGSDRIGLDWIGLDWIGWVWIGSDRIGSDGFGLDWIGLDWFWQDGSVRVISVSEQQLLRTYSVSKLALSSVALTTNPAAIPPRQTHTRTGRHAPFLALVAPTAQSVLRLSATPLRCAHVRAQLGLRHAYSTLDHHLRTHR